MEDIPRRRARRRRRYHEDPTFREHAIAAACTYAHNHKDQKSARARALYGEKRRAVILLLGGRCSQCGFDDPRALQIDHIRADGAQDRRRFSNNGPLYTRILTMPSDLRAAQFQLLCANCNWAKREKEGESGGKAPVPGHPARPSTTRRLREAILLSLGGFCHHCGYKELGLLQIDHVNGGGVAEWRQYAGHPGRYYHMILGLPLDERHLRYQALCPNCNWIKRVEHGEIG